MAPSLRRGIVAERRFDHAEWQRMSPGQRRGMAHLLHVPVTRPDFVAYRVDDLPAPATRLAWLFAMRVLTWTVRNVAQRERAAVWADQMIFEGFRP
jgi:glycerophosphoryl diester phosphodiesterase